MLRKRFKIENHEIVTGYDNLKKAWRSLPDGDYACEIKKWTNSKTLRQIRTVKGVLIPKLSQHLGEPRKSLERRLKMDYGVCEYFEKDGERFVDIMSFTYYDKNQMRAFIDGVLEEAEFEHSFIIDLELRKQLLLDDETGELLEV